MAKVRYNNKCAGTCGKMLMSGSFGMRMHGNWWCMACALKHKQVCLQFAKH